MVDSENQMLVKAAAFFEKARNVAMTNNYDAAIEMYLQGLQCAPDSVEQGHVKLRELSLLRQTKGGLKPTDAEKLKYMQAQTSLQQMLNAEFLLAKDPTQLIYAENILKAAAAAGYKETVKWIADLVFLANKAAKKPSFQLYILLKNSYQSIGLFDRALAACRFARRLKLEDQGLDEDIKRLLGKKILNKAHQGQNDSVTHPQVTSTAVDEAKKGSQSENMSEDVDAKLAKAMVFFAKAAKAAEINNFDYAIDMFLEGIRCAPDAAAQGHAKLREMAYLRLLRGGKKPSMMEKMKFSRGKTPLEQMTNAEYLFAKEPDNLSYAETILKAAIAGGYKETAKWAADLLFQANNNSPKPSLQTYVLLKDAYFSIGQFERALAACQFAVRLKPTDVELTGEYQRLSAELTVSRGKYDQAGDFRNSIKNREVQENFQLQQNVVKTEDYRLTALEDARKKLAQDRNLPMNINHLVDALLDLQDDNSDAEAIELLEDTFKAKQDFSFKHRAGEIKIKQIKRKIRNEKSILETKPDDAAAKTKLAELSSQLINAELQHWRICVENYPTDLQAKYEYGNCLIQAKRYDDAIPLFQEAQRDPRNKTSSMGKIGLCFFKKGWFTDAIDIFNQALDACEIKDDSIAKELRYNLARSYEEQGDKDKALELYRKIAQLDFAYKDVRQRVDKLRTKEG